MPTTSPLDRYLALALRHLAALGTPAVEDPARKAALDEAWVALSREQRDEACDLVSRARGRFRVEVKTMKTSAGDRHMVNIQHPARPADASIFETAGIITPFESGNLEHAQAEARAWASFLDPVPTWTQMLAGRHLDPALVKPSPGQSEDPASRDMAPIGAAVVQVLTSHREQGQRPGPFVALLEAMLAADPFCDTDQQRGAMFVDVVRAPHRGWMDTPDWEFVSQVARLAAGLAPRIRGPGA